jgi:IS66 Orf2 like protein
VLSLPSALRIFLAADPADMRKGFDGLARLVRDNIAEDPLSGHLFVFRNRRRDRVTILDWDRDGFALWYNGNLSSGSPGIIHEPARVQFERVKAPTLKSSPGPGLDQCQRHLSALAA